MGSVLFVSGILTCHYKLCNDKKNDQFVFLNNRGRYYIPSDIGHRLTYYLDAHQLQSLNVTPHILRHTFATRCFEAGINAKVVQHLLGHSDIQMTLNLYTHVDTKVLHENISKLSFTKMA